MYHGFRKYKEMIGKGREQGKNENRERRMTGNKEKSQMVRDQFRQYNQYRGNYICNAAILSYLSKMTFCIIQYTFVFCCLCCTHLFLPPVMKVVVGIARRARPARAARGSRASRPFSPGQGTNV